MIACSASKTHREVKEERLTARIEKAHLHDATVLTRVATRAFKNDNRFKPSEADMNGPPGNDQVQTHEKRIKSVYYYKVSLQDRIIGGCFLKSVTEDHYAIHGIFIDPDFQNRGYGQKLLEFVLHRHAEIRKWSLETPDYSARNRHFYEKMGFRKTGRSEIRKDLGWAFIYYQKSGYLPSTH